MAEQTKLPEVKHLTKYLIVRKSGFKKISERRYLKKIEKRIDAAKTPEELMMMLRSQYAMSWLKYSKDFLSNEEFSELFETAWVNCETANMDVNVPVEEAAEWFKNADKKSLMNKEEYEKFISLPEMLTLYRGVARGRVEKGMSWTTLRSKAN